MACREGVFEKFVISSGMERQQLFASKPTGAEAERLELVLEERQAMALTSTIARIDSFQVSGWQTRAATGLAVVGLWAYYTGTSAHTWAVGGTVFVRQLTCIYGVSDALFTAVEIVHDYREVSQRRMSTATFEQNVWKKLTWCGITITAFWVGGKVMVALIVGGSVFATGVSAATWPFILGGLLGVSIASIAQITFYNSDWINRLGSARPDLDLGTSTNHRSDTALAING